MVYQCLLERDEKTIWRIYSLGRRGEVVSYEKLQSEFHFTAKFSACVNGGQKLKERRKSELILFQLKEAYSYK